jgi:hypothetical protein
MVLFTQMSLIKRIKYAKENMHSYKSYFPCTSLVYKDCNEMNRES